MALLRLLRAFDVSPTVVGRFPLVVMGGRLNYVDGVSSGANGVIISHDDMTRCAAEHGLEFLLAFDGRIHHLEKGYWLKFEIRRVETTTNRPHGLSYSFTLHAPSGTRLVGFDNAHVVPARGSAFKRRDDATDHWHRTEKDLGRPYRFKDAETLIEDFFDAVERVLLERGVGLRVTKTEASRRSK
jgi:hypothetical protein